MIRKWITKIVNEQITNALEEDDEMPYKIAFHIDEQNVAGWMSASEVAGHMDTYDIAREIDVYDVAYNIDSGDVAEYMDVGDVAHHIDMDALSRYVSDEVEVDYKKLAKAVIKYQKENTGEEE